jgi:integrase
MSLYRRGNVWWSRIELDGKVHQFSTKARNKNVARGIESVKRTELAQGRAGLTAPTLVDFSNRFLDSLRARLTHETFRFYSCHYMPLIRFPALRASRLDRITPAIVEDFVQWRKQQHANLSPVTINHNLRTLRRVLHLAAEWDVIAKVPKIRLLPGENQRTFVLTDAVVMKFSKAPGLIGQIVPFLVDTGLRRAEAVNLLWAAVNLDAAPPSIEVTKGKTKYAHRRIPLTVRAARILADVKKTAKTSNVFKISNDWLSHEFTRVRKKLELPAACVLHSTRHTFCTRLGERGADAFAIQRLAGHSSIVISQRYVHASGPRLDTAIALLEPGAGAKRKAAFVIPNSRKPE